MTTLSFDRFGPTPFTDADAGLISDAEADDEAALERSREAMKIHAVAFGFILDAADSEYGWDGMPECFKAVAEELGMI